MAIPGGNIQALAAAQQSGDGGLIVFVVDQGGAIWALSQDSAGGAFGQWDGPKWKGQPVAALQVAAAGRNDGNLMLIMLDAQGMVWTLSQDGPGAGWGQWQGPAVGGQQFSWQRIAAAQQHGNRGIQIWAVDYNDQIWTLYQTTPGGSWSSWEGPGFKGQPTLFGSIAAAGQGNGDVMLFALDLADQVWLIGQGSPGGDWGAWSGPNVGGEPSPCSSLAAAEQGRNRGVVLWGLDRQGQISTLYQTTPGGAWSNWEGPGFKSQPKPFLRIAAGGRNNGNCMVLGVSKAGKLWYVSQLSPGGDWGAWGSLAGPAFSAVEARAEFQAERPVASGAGAPRQLPQEPPTRAPEPKPNPASARRIDSPTISDPRVVPAAQRTRQRANAGQDGGGLIGWIRRLLARLFGG